METGPSPGFGTLLRRYRVAAGLSQEQLAERSGNLQVLRCTSCLLAERDLLTGHPAEAQSRLVPLLNQPSPEGRGEAWLLWLLAWTHLDPGAVGQAADEVRRVLTRLREHPLEQNDRRSWVEALRVQAMVLTRQEHWAETERAVEEGLSFARNMPYPYGEARLLDVCGEMHARKGGVRVGAGAAGRGTGDLPAVGRAQGCRARRAVLAPYRG